LQFSLQEGKEFVSIQLLAITINASLSLSLSLSLKGRNDDSNCLSIPIMEEQTLGFFFMNFLSLHEVEL